MKTNALHNIVYICLLSLTMLITESCKEDEERTAPIVHAASPKLPKIGDTLTITGENFAEIVMDNLVYINGKVALQYVSGTTTELRVIVPPAALSGDLVVSSNYAHKSNPIHLDVFKRDVQVFSITPNNTTEAPIGSVVEIKGQNFLPDDFLAGKASVWFTTPNGPVQATVLYVAEGALQVIVPDGVITGPIEVQQEGFKYTGPVFTLSRPEIYTLSAQQVREGDVLSFTGKALNLVYMYRLGQVEANPEGFGDTENSFSVPAGLEPGVYAVEYLFQNEWQVSDQTVEVLPLENIVKTVYWERFGRLNKTSIDASGNYRHARVDITGGRAFNYDAGKQKLYFFHTSSMNIFSATRAGKPSVLYTWDIGAPEDIVSDNGHLYWSDSNTGCLKSAPDDGAGTVQYLYCNYGTFKEGIDVLDGYVYWVDPDNLGLMRAAADGTGAAESISFTGADVASLKDVEVVNINGRVYIYLVVTPANGEVYLYTGELANGNVALAPFTMLTPATGAPYGIRRVNVDRARSKVIWGNNYAGSHQLWESDLDGSNPILLMGDNENIFDHVVVLEN